MREDVSRDEFAEQIDTEFGVHFVEGTPVPLKLTRVSERKLKSGYENFKLVFLGPEGEPLYQNQTLMVEHPELGELEMSIQPVAFAKGGIEYQAIFVRDADDQPED